MGMTVKTVTRWLKGPILLFGIYLVMYGHITPGGGFGGGVVIASAFILITLASGERAALHLFSKGVHPGSTVSACWLSGTGLAGHRLGRSLLLQQLYQHAGSSAVHPAQRRNHADGQHGAGTQGRQRTVPGLHLTDSISHLRSRS